MGELEQIAVGEVRRAWFAQGVGQSEVKTPRRCILIWSEIAYTREGPADLVFSRKLGCGPGGRAHAPAGSPVRGWGAELICFHRTV